MSDWRPTFELLSGMPVPEKWLRTPVQYDKIPLQPVAFVRHFFADSHCRRVILFAGSEHIDPAEPIPPLPLFTVMFLDQKASGADHAETGDWTDEHKGRAMCYYADLGALAAAMWQHAYWKDGYNFHLALSVRFKNMHTRPAGIAVRKRDAKFLQWLLRAGGKYLIGDGPVQEALRRGAFDDALFAGEQGCCWPDGFMCSENLLRNTKFLAKAVEAGANWDAGLTSWAAANQYVMFILRVTALGCPWAKDTTVPLAARGDVNTALRLTEVGCPWHATTTLEAARCGKYEFVAAAIAAGCPCHAQTAEVAAEAGEFSFARTLLEGAHCAYTAPLLIAAATAGAVDFARDAVKNGCPVPPTAIAAALRCGKFDFAHVANAEWKQPWPADAMLRAAEHNAIGFVKTGRAAGCKWHPRTTIVAAKNNNIDFALEAMKHGCTWASSTLNSAARKGYVDFAATAVERGFCLTELVFISARRKHQYEFMRWYVKHTGESELLRGVRFEKYSHRWQRQRAFHYWQ